MIAWLLLILLVVVMVASAPSTWRMLREEIQKCWGGEEDATTDANHVPLRKDISG